jgi:transcriptional regulator with GAF, ATPase, and Fis domain/tetratricopeptide (TPR) repeat protein
MNHGRYEIVERLGQGESATVYRARDLALGGRDVALKVLKQQDDRDAARFRREFEALSQLKHPNLIAVIDFGVALDGDLYYSAEYHPGQRSLRDLLDSEALTLDRRLEIVVVILRALEYVHTRGLVHRDLKPENVLIDDAGTVRIGDFGLVGVEEGQAAGTPHYMPPEVLRRLRVDRRCDLYSLGVILYELLTDTLPYDGHTAQEIAQKHLNDRPLSPRAHRSELPQELERIVLKLLEKEPSDRYPSANAVVEALGKATGKPYAFETSETKQAYVLSGRFVGRDREIDWLHEAYLRATGPLDWARDPRSFDRRARFETARSPSQSGNRRRGGDRRASAVDASDNPPALMVLLRGESGVGKTRLALELRRQCQLEGALFLQGKCKKHQARGYEPFISIFKEAARLPGNTEDLDWAVAQLLGRTAGKEEKGVERLRLVDALAEFLIAQSVKRPLVVCLENLQWARGETLELLQHLYRSLVAVVAGAESEDERPQLFVLGTYRPEEIHGPELGRALEELSRDRFFEELSLLPLQADDSSELIRSMLGVPDVPRAFVDRVMSETRGNPLFIELLMEELVDRGVVDRTRGLWRLDRKLAESIEVPTRVHDLVLTRLERLPQRAVLEWLAVLNRGAKPELVAVLADATEGVVIAELEALCRQRLVEREDRVYSLSHSRVRDAVYASLPDRAIHHGRVATALEERYGLDDGVTQAELAHHLLEAGAGLEAIRWARKASEEAANLGAAERACELYTRALRAADDHLALVLGNAEAVRPLNEEKLTILRALVHQLSAVGRHGEARARTLEGLEVARELDDAQAEVAALAHLGSLNATLKEGDDAKRYFFEALKKAEHIEYGKGIGTSLLGLGDLILEEGRLGEAVEYLERSLEFEKDLGDGREISSYMRALANTLRKQGKASEALVYAERALEQDQQAGNRGSRIETLELITDLHFLEGKFDLAIDAAEQGLAVAELQNDKGAQARFLLALGSAQTRQGQRSEGGRRFSEALSLTRRLGLGPELAQVLNAVGWIHHQSGDYEQALTAFNEATTLWNTQGDREGYALGLINLGLAYGQRGELVRAAACYDAASRIAWEIASKGAELEAARGRASIHRLAGELESARQLLDKTVLRAREQKQPRLEAMALADQARLLAGSGEGSRGLRAARRARALARELRDEEVTTLVTLRSAEVDLLRGALGPAVDAFRLRTTWLRGGHYVLALEAELGHGVALGRLGDLEGARAALEATLTEAETRGLRPLVARVRLAQGRLLIERALLRGGYRPGRVLVAGAELGEARASFDAARSEAKGCDALDLIHMADLGLARVALLDGRTPEATQIVERIADPAGRSVEEASLLLAELALPVDVERAMLLADDIEASSPWARTRAALVKADACERAGLRLEARQALDEGGLAQQELTRGLDAADRRLAEETALAIALRTAQDKVREEVMARPDEDAANGASRLDRERVMGFLRASRDVQRQSSSEAQLRSILDRALALFGARRGLLVKIDPQGEQAVKRARLAPGKDLPKSEQGYSSSIVGHVARTGEVLVLPDASKHLDLGERPSVVDLQLRSLLAVPLRLRGRTVYVLVLEDRSSADRFCEEDRELAETFCEVSAYALERSRLRSELDLADNELRSRAREIERLKAALDTKVSEQTLELDAVKAALKGREYELGVQSSYENLIGQSEPMCRVFKLLDKVASSDVPILIQGESGTGKELVARAVHFNGVRKDAPFLSVNVAALPESLLEAELFGHIKGAFTGADRDKQGLFEAADGGTLFLDEIGDMAPSMQTKLLRVLQEGEVRPIGCNKPRKVSVRIVSASNKNLRELVDEGRFRADLFYRLNVVPIPLPPLRERKDDIPLLVDHLLDKIAKRLDEPRKSVEPKVIDHLLHHDWPGNVRELENELRRLVALSGVRITERDLSGHLQRRPADRVEVSVARDETKTLKEQIALIERRLLVQALRSNNNNKTQTAKHLGLSRYGFLKKLDKYHLRDTDK